VFWRAAFAGAFVVAALLMLNNLVAFFYVRRVVQTQNLYGQLAVPLVLMLGLYIFWLYILIGGVISYAVQNVHFRNSQAAWGQLAESMRERLSLVVLLTIGRRFQGCLPPVTASQLSDLLKVPTQILNECLNRLVEMNLITTLRPAPNTPATEHRYQPARPLGRINLFDFKTLDDNFGDDPIGQSLERIDPILHHYDDALNRIGEHPFFQKSLEALFTEHPFDESRPPFTLGHKRSG
jgi:membrane protein